MTRIRLTLIGVVLLLGLLVSSAFASHYSVQSLHGDVNCDGVVNVIDALFILQYDVGIEVPDFPDCPHIGQAIP